MDKILNMDKTNAKDTPLVSVIVPVYKVEKYLRRCVDSIVNQTYPEFELLLVDDGSPDNCGKICDEYEEKYSFIRVIHQKNQGLSAARNNAVSFTCGDYITFIDSDDYVTADYIEYLVGLLQQYGADISVGGYVYQFEGKEIVIPREETKSEYIDTEKALEYMNYGKGFSVFAWGKLYKRELIEAFPYPDGKLYEDLATTYRIISASSGVAYGNKQIYYWVQRAGSTTRSEFNEKQLDGIEAAKAQLAFFTEHHPEAVPAAKARYEAKIVELLSLALKSNHSREHYRRIKGLSRYYTEVMADPNVKKTVKIRMASMRLGYLPSRIVFYVHERMKERML